MWNVLCAMIAMNASNLTMAIYILAEAEHPYNPDVFQIMYFYGVLWYLILTIIISIAVWKWFGIPEKVFPRFGLHKYLIPSKDIDEDAE